MTKDEILDKLARNEIDVETASKLLGELEAEEGRQKAEQTKAGNREPTSQRRPSNSPASAPADMRSKGEFQVGCGFAAFLAICIVMWLIRTSNPVKVVDDWDVGKDRRGWYYQEESHYEKQRTTLDAVGAIVVLVAVIVFGLWCLSMTEKSSTAATPTNSSEVADASAPVASPDESRPTDATGESGSVDDDVNDRV